jgi:alpha-beta hydrolase superfamily lysophospholipase
VAIADDQAEFLDVASQRNDVTVECCGVPYSIFRIERKMVRRNVPVDLQPGRPDNPAMAAFEATALSSPTGATLALRHLPAQVSAIAVVHVNHGLAEHSGRYARFATALSQAGFHVYAHDHRGHGATRAPDAPLGRFADRDGTTKVLDDIDAVHGHIAKRHPGLPLLIFGHSMGGIVALNAVLRRSHHLAGTAIWNTNVSAGAMARLALALLAWERFRRGADMPSRILPKLTFQAWGRAIPDARSPFDWLSRDPAEVEAYIADTLRGWDPSVSMWRDVFRMILTASDDRSYTPGRRTLPFHLVGGGADPSTDNGKAVEALAARLSRMGFSNLETRIWPNNRHEGLNDLDRQAVTEDFIDWARRTAGAHA